jgi:hypothetical protein
MRKALLNQVLAVLALTGCGYSRVAYVPAPDRFKSTEEAVEVVRFGLTNAGGGVTRAEVTNTHMSFIWKGKPYKVRYADLEEVKLYERTGITRVQSSGIKTGTAVDLTFLGGFAVIDFHEQGEAIRFMDALEFLRARR